MGNNHCYHFDNESTVLNMKELRTVLINSLADTDKALQ